MCYRTQPGPSICPQRAGFAALGRVNAKFAGLRFCLAGPGSAAQTPEFVEVHGMFRHSRQPRHPISARAYCSEPRKSTFAGIESNNLQWACCGFKQLSKKRFQLIATPPQTSQRRREAAATASSDTHLRKAGVLVEPRCQIQVCSISAVIQYSTVCLACGSVFKFTVGRGTRPILIL